MERVRLKTKRKLFEKGNSQGGRKPGVPNKMTTQIKTAIIEAAELIGQDGKGQHGLVGYLAMLAEDHPPVFARLLEKLLPMQLTGNLQTTDIHRYETSEEIAQALRARGLPPPSQLIDVTPNASHTLVPAE